MNTMAVIILVLVAAMIIGPVAMLRLSPGQKRRDLLRARARAQGLSVSLRIPPQRPTDTEPAGHMPAYSLVCKGADNWFLVRTSYAHPLHLNDWWQFVANKPEQKVQAFLAGALQMLPEGVVGVGSQGGELVVFWRESGQEAAVDQISRFLHQLAECQSSSLSMRCSSSEANSGNSA